MPEETTQLLDLVAIEQIKQLKARYFRLMDLRAWDEWPAVFTPDCVMRLLGDPPVLLEGCTAIVDSARRNLDPRAGVHLGQMPEISIIGPDSATGVWSLFAFSVPKNPGLEGATGPGMMSFGRYEDDYRRDSEGHWRIAATSLSTVVRVMGAAPQNVDVLGPSNGVVVYGL
jgi:hypothetical protein